MVSEIQKELEENYEQMSILVGKQQFTVADAEHFMKRYHNIIRKMEDLETSRDLWKNKYRDFLIDLEECQRCELCLKHSKGRDNGKKSKGSD